MYSQPASIPAEIFGKMKLQKSSKSHVTTLVQKAKMVGEIFHSLLELTGDCVSGGGGGGGGGATM